MYDKMLQFVKDSLAEYDVAATQLGNSYPFRKRSEHTKRVFMWAKRLIDDTQLEKPVNKEAVLISAIFHDSGYADYLNKSEHAISSAILCEKYLRENKYSDGFKDFVVYLVQNHSKKKLMTEKDTPLELILLMEADMLDETGAMSILWDCMAEGRQQEQTYVYTYNRVLKHAYKFMNVHPMVTPKAKAFWESKQKLMQEFITNLSFDLGIDVSGELYFGGE